MSERERDLWPKLLSRWWGHQSQEGIKEEKREDSLGETAMRSVFVQLSLK